LPRKYYPLKAFARNGHRSRIVSNAIATKLRQHRPIPDIRPLLHEIRRLDLHRRLHRQQLERPQLLPILSQMYATPHSPPPTHTTHPTNPDSHSIQITRTQHTLPLQQRKMVLFKRRQHHLLLLRPLSLDLQRHRSSRRYLQWFRVGAGFYTRSICGSEDGEDGGEFPYWICAAG